jgi:hypothetical protein
MEGCIKYGGTVHCLVIPLLEWPFRVPTPGPGPINYPLFLQDVTIVASLDRT